MRGGDRNPESLCYTFSDVTTIYKKNFSACDRMNSYISLYGFPFKRGGRDVPGTSGQEDQFLFSTLILNVYFAHLSVNNIKYSDLSVKAMCDELSEEVFAYGADLIRRGGRAGRHH